MPKRGLGRRAAGDITHNIYLIVFEAVMVAVIFLALMNNVRSIYKDTFFERTYLSKDIALLVTAIESSPGNLNYVYTHPKIDLNGFDFVFDKDSVGVLSEVQGSTGSLQSSMVYYPYASDKNISFDPINLKTPYAILFSLQEKKLTISASTIEQTLSCNDVDTKDQDSKNKKIVVDPGHGVDTRFGPGAQSSDTGTVNDEKGLVEYQLTKQISTALISQLNDAGYRNTVLTRQDNFVSMADRRSICDSSDLCISVHTGSEYGNYNGVRVYIYAASPNLLKSEKLACLILREFGRKFSNLTRVEIIRVESSNIPEDDSRQILLTDKVSVIVEIGNIQMNEGLLYLPSPEIAAPIKDAIRNYYE